MKPSCARPVKVDAIARRHHTFNQFAIIDETLNRDSAAASTGSDWGATMCAIHQLQLSARANYRTVLHARTITPPLALLAH